MPLVGLENVDSKFAVKRLLPNSLGDYTEDARLLPGCIRISSSVLKPHSSTIDFWDKQSKPTSTVDISGAIRALRK